MFSGFALNRDPYHIRDFSYFLTGFCDDEDTEPLLYLHVSG
jgi:hypothetical protein